MNTPKVDAIRERIRQVKLELARLKMVERLAQMETKRVQRRRVRHAR